MLIKLRDQVPTIYTDASRDFQYLGWLTNIVLNSVKHNVDDIYDLPNTKADPKLTSLLATTLGFKVKRNYNQKQLTALVSIIPSILKYKGTLTAVKLAGQALVRASGSTGQFKYEYKPETRSLEVLFPKTLVDTTLFMDLLPYILPGGMPCRIVYDHIETQGIDPIDVDYLDILEAELVQEIELNDKQQATGLSSMFDANDTEVSSSTFANLDYYTDAEGKKQPKPNFGLLDNNLIATVDEPLVANTDENTGGNT